MNKIIGSLLAILFFLSSGCSSFKWRVSTLDTGKKSKVEGISKLQRMCSAAGGNYDDESKVCKDVLVVTDIGMADKVGCYLTFIAYGGWCWFIQPSSKDYANAKAEARRELGSEAKVEYLGKD